MKQRSLVIKQFESSYQQFKRNNYSIAYSRLGDNIITQQIGKGAFGSVYHGFNLNKNKQIAAKVIDLYKINNNKNQFQRKQLLKYAQSEGQLLSVCDSPNIIKCYQVFQSEHLKILILEYCTGGTLNAKIKRHKRINEKHATMIIKQIIDGVIEMHRNRIMHRDLKSLNILQHNNIIKIADLGTSKSLIKDIEQEATWVGTLGTMAPEVVRFEKYGMKADIWSIGVIYFQMIFGQIPLNCDSFHQDQEFSPYSQILSQESITYNGYTASIKSSNFLRDLLTVKSSDRIGSKQLIEHSFFENLVSLNNFISNIKQQCNHVQQKLTDENQKISNQTEVKTQIIKKRYLETHQLAFLPPTSHVFSNVFSSLQEQAQIQKSLISLKLQQTKAAFIFNHLIHPLKRHQAFDKQRRIHCEMMYLFITRCLNTLSSCERQIKKKQMKKTHQVFLVNITRFLTKIKRYWIDYSEEIFMRENQVGSIIIDGFKKIFKVQSFNKKEKFLTGLQQQDYSKSQQIAYTMKKYISPFLQENKCSKNTELIQIMKVMAKYTSIWNTKITDLHNHHFAYQFFSQALC